eukprot:g70.t1
MSAAAQQGVSMHGHSQLQSSDSLQGAGAVFSYHCQPCGYDLCPACANEELGLGRNNVDIANNSSRRDAPSVLVWASVWNPRRAYGRTWVIDAGSGRFVREHDRRFVLAQQVQEQGSFFSKKEKRKHDLIRARLEELAGSAEEDRTARAAPDTDRLHEAGADVVPGALKVEDASSSSKESDPSSLSTPPAVATNEDVQKVRSANGDGNRVATEDNDSNKEGAGSASLDAVVQACFAIDGVRSNILSFAMDVVFPVQFLLLNASLWSGEFAKWILEDGLLWQNVALHVFPTANPLLTWLNFGYVKRRLLATWLFRDVPAARIHGIAREHDTTAFRSGNADAIFVSAAQQQGGSRQGGNSVSNDLMDSHRRNFSEQRPTRYLASHAIENCDEAQCPMAWESLQFQSRESEHIRVCQHCRQDVYYSEDIENAMAHVRRNHKFAATEADPAEQSPVASPNAVYAQQQAPASGGPPPEQYARRSGPPSARSINPSSISNAAPPAPASIPAPVPAGAADNSNSNDYYHRLHAQYGAAAVTDYSGAGVYSGMAGGGSMEEPLLQDPSLAQNRARLRERRQHAGLFSSHLYDRDGNYVGVHSDPSLLHQGSDPGVYNGTTSAARGASSLNSARGGGGGRYGSTSKGPRRKKTMLEYLLRKMQKPEVILLSVWWLIMFSLLLFLADLWSLLVLIWKPLLFLIAVPVICFTVVLVVTL